ncbi:MAG: aminotransferase class V-fold PLP-dependent enzyme [Dehalococcoidales bacterium]|nr:aminotransferase class V-fold PLP-dependent enzyme [Dehalococcoidales bacterium]
MIYLDNAATSFHKPQEVIDAVVNAMKTMGNAGRGVNDASLDASRMLYDTREKLAKLFNSTDPCNVAFTCNSTEALNIALKGLLDPGDHVITTELEHNSVLRPLYELEAKGVELTIIEADKKGLIDYDDFDKSFRPNTKLVVCTHASNLTGNMLDITLIGRKAHDHGALFVVDASQTAGVFHIDVQAMDIDVLCFTGHKSLLGPQGTGGIVVREGLKVRPLKTGGSGVKTYSKTHPADMPTALEAGTLNSHGIAGLNAALDYLERVGIDNIREKELSLMWRFYNGIKDIEGIQIYGDFSKPLRSPIVSFNLAEFDSSTVGDELYNTYDISVRTGGHCAPLMHKALGTIDKGAVRFSFSHMNTEEEIDEAIAAIRDMISEA